MLKNTTISPKHKIQAPMSCAGDLTKTPIIPETNSGHYKGLMDRTINNR
ncbi:MAG: hypothetical protein IPM47_07365 [Sphingobacteriales bacterium]|nr:MAG: hypothetical protein IPM47_07365 [Sphingobacteriales bacterium]